VERAIEYICGFCCNLMSHGCGFDIWAFLDLESPVFSELGVLEVGKGMTGKF
jgi:hypothetical protein